MMERNVEQIERLRTGEESTAAGFQRCWGMGELKGVVLLGSQYRAGAEN
jgi:hypothetical protein